MPIHKALHTFRNTILPATLNSYSVIFFFNNKLLGAVIMLVTFAAFVWMAAKVYRTGILMYGKKTSWKEMWKWLRYSG